MSPEIISTVRRPEKIFPYATAKAVSASSEVPSPHKLRIDTLNKRIAVDGRTLWLNENAGVSWQVLLVLAADPKREWASLEIKEIASKAGSESLKKAGGVVISNLRQILEKDPKKPEIILTINPGLKNIKYVLNAEVEMGEIPDELFFERKHKRDLAEGQERVAMALFTLKEDRSGFKNESIDQAIREAYADNLSLQDSEQGRQRISRYREAFQRTRHQIAIRIAEVANVPVDQIRLPRLAKFVGWLREQPEYSKATLEQLVLVMERKISFDELKDTALPFRLTSSQIYVFAIILRAPIYRRVLEKCGIMLGDRELRVIDNVVSSVKPRTQGGERFDVASLLKAEITYEFWQKLLLIGNCDREDVLRQNGEEAKTLIELFRALNREKFVGLIKELQQAFEKNNKK